jgi:formate dehydrogenase major subunit
MRTPNVELRSIDTLDISIEDATRLSLDNSERVRVRSRYGAVLISIRINPAVKPGELFGTFHTSDVFLNRLIGSGRDEAMHTPEYKVVVVQIEKLATAPQ